MKCLFISVDPAFPPVSGADLRVWQNVQAAAGLGPVILASIGEPATVSAPEGIRIEHLSGMETSDVWRSDFDVTFSPAVIRSLEALSAEFLPDVVVLESLPLFDLAGVLKDRTTAVVLDLHNIESDLVDQEADGKSLLPFEEIRTRANRIREFEQKTAATADMIWVCSSEDREKLIQNDIEADRIAVVANGIPRPHDVEVHPDRGVRRGGPTLLFLGHLSYAPNVEAAVSLMDLMPSLWERLPKSHLLIAGRTPHPTLSKRHQPGRINVIGDPPSTRPLLLAADLAVLPLARGGGTRIKALEAMAWGLPVIASAKAVEGLQLADGETVLLAETAGEFVNAICELWTDSERLNALRLAGRSHVMSKFGPGTIERAVQGSLSFVVSDRGR